MKLILLVALFVFGMTVNVFGQVQSAAPSQNPDNVTSVDNKSLDVTSPAQPRIEHPEFFWQAQDHENVVIPQTSFMANHSGAEFGTNDTKTTTLGLEYQRGLTRHLAVSLDADYSTSQTVMGGGLGNGGAAFSTDGLQDLVLSLKGFSGEGATRIYYGLGFNLSIESAQYSSNDGVNFTGNNYSGGQSVVPSLGIAWILSPRKTIGLFSSYQVRDQRSVEFSNQGNMLNFDETGGNVLKGGFFYEQAFENWKLGVTAGVENDEAAVSNSSNFTLLNLPGPQLYGVVSAYSAIKAGSNFDVLPSISYQTEIDENGGSSLGTSQMSIAMAGRMVF